MILKKNHKDKKFQAVKSQSGNIFMTLFAAVAIVGAVGAGTVSILRGPVSSMVSINQQNMTEIRMEIAAKLVMSNAINGFSADGDSGTDFFELAPYDAGTITGGGLIPAALNINDIDPWGSQFGYCTWDNGDALNGKDDAGTGTDNRLNGQNLITSESVALISAGPNRTFETGCYAYGDAVPEGIVRASGSDDIIVTYTYQDAIETMGDVWKYATDQNTATEETVLAVDTNLDLRANVTMTGLLQFDIAASGLVLPASPGAACSVAQDGQLFLDSATVPPTMVVCDTLVTSAVIEGGEITTSDPGEGGQANPGNISNIVWRWGITPYTVEGAIADYIMISNNNPNTSNMNTCGLKADGTVWCWGDNTQGQLGDGTNVDATTSIPTQVLNVKGASFIAAGDGFACALQKGGQAWCWGGNTHGQLGDGTNTPSNNPVLVTGDHKFTEIHSALNESVCGLKTDETVWCWGRFGTGLLGSLPSSSTNIPRQVSNIENIIDISSGRQHVCAIDRNGQVWCWGNNDSGEMGIGTTSNREDVPVKILSNEKFQKTAGGPGTNCALSVSNEIWCWGKDGQGNALAGRAGNGTAKFNDVLIPEKIDDTEQDYVDIVANARNFCGIKSDGRVFCWGGRDHNGTGAPSARESPALVINVSNIVNISGSGLEEFYGIERNVITGDTDAPTSGYEIVQDRSAGAQIGSNALAITRDNSTVNHEAGISLTVDETSITGADTVSAGISGQNRGADGSALVLRLQNPAGTAASIRMTVDPEGNMGLSSSMAANDAILTTGSNATMTWNQNYRYGALITDDTYGTPQSNYFGIDETTGAAMLLFSKDFYISHTDATGSSLQDMAYFAAGNPVEIYEDLEQFKTDYGSITMHVNSDTPADMPMLKFERYGGTPAASTVVSTESVLGRLEFNGYTGTVYNTDGQISIEARQSGTLGAGTLESQIDIKNHNDSTIVSISDNSVLIGDSMPFTRQLKVNGRGAVDEGIKIGNSADACTSNNESHIRYTGTEVEYCDGSEWSPWNNNTDKSLACEHAEMITHVSTGDFTSCTTFSNGQTSCFGAGEKGALGNGDVSVTNHTKLWPISQGTLPEMKKVYGGRYTSCGIDVHNDAWCWGDNTYGQLGNGSAVTETGIPQKVIFQEKFKSLSNGGEQICAITQSDRVACWGRNQHGQASGDGANGDKSLPVYVRNMAGAKQIEISNWSSHALLKDGTVWSWGFSQGGNFGNGAAVGALQTPTKATITDVQKIAVGGYNSGLSFVCALKYDGTVWCWGNNDDQQLGNGAGVAQLSPVQVSGISNIIDIQAGFSFIHVLDSDGSVQGWGNNVAGVLGTNAADNADTTPITIPDLEVSQLADSSYYSRHMCFIATDNKTKCIGYDNSGQLGQGTPASSNTPVDVKNPLLCDADKLVFITSDGYLGNLGGIEGADEKCQIKADEAGLPGTYYAWLSDDTIYPAMRFNKNHGAIYLADNATKIVDDWDDLIDGSLDNKIDQDETGAGKGDTPITNTTSAGEILNTTSSLNCRNFTSSGGGTSRHRGTYNSTGAAWTDFGPNACSSPDLGLFCFQQ